jgi:hypothetical protein
MVPKKKIFFSKKIFKVFFKKDIILSQLEKEPLVIINYIILGRMIFSLFSACVCVCIFLDLIFFFT